MIIFFHLLNVGETDPFSSFASSQSSLFVTLKMYNQNSGSEKCKRGYDLRLPTQNELQRLNVQYLFFFNHSFHMVVVLSNIGMDKLFRRINIILS